MKDRITLLLCGDASGACKIKLMIIYHSENSWIFKRNKVMKNKLVLYGSQMLSLGVLGSFLLSG